MPFLGALVAFRPFCASLGAAGACALSFLARAHLPFVYLGSRPWSGDRRPTLPDLRNFEWSLGGNSLRSGAPAVTGAPSLPLERLSSLSDLEESLVEGGVDLRGPGPCFLPVSTGSSSTTSPPGSGGISAGPRPSSMPPTKKRIYLQFM